jgi:hypothetical protein
MGKLINNYVSIGGIDRIVEISGAETITDKTLTAPTLNTPTVNNSLLATPRESWAVNTNAGGSLALITTSINLNPKTETKSAWLYTGNTSGTWTVNIGHASSNLDADSLNNYLATGESITISLAVYISNAAAYATALTIDGAATTIYWQGGITPSAGSLNAFDVYTYTIIKTAANTYTIFASKTEFDN